MDVELPELPFALRTYGPDGHWSYEDGVLTGWAGPRHDRFVPPTGEALDPACDAPRLLGAPDGDFQLIARVTVGFRAAFDAGVLRPRRRPGLGQALPGVLPGRAHRLHRGHPGPLRRRQ